MHVLRRATRVLEAGRFDTMPRRRASKTRPALREYKSLFGNLPETKSARVDFIKAGRRCVGRLGFNAIRRERRSLGGAGDVRRVRLRNGCNKYRKSASDDGGDIPLRKRDDGGTSADGRRQPVSWPRAKPRPEPSCRQTGLCETWCHLGVIWDSVPLSFREREMASRLRARPQTHRMLTF